MRREYSNYKKWSGVEWGLYFMGASPQTPGLAALEFIRYYTSRLGGIYISRYSDVWNLHVLVCVLDYILDGY